MANQHGGNGRPVRKKKATERATYAIAKGQHIPGISTTSHVLSPPSNSSPTHIKYDDAIRNLNHSINMQSKKPAKSKGKAAEVDDSRYGPSKLLIYQWPPTRSGFNIDNVSNAIKEFKRRKDAEEGAADIDDGSVDWDQFSGDPELYENTRISVGSADSLHDQMLMCVARTFVNRAKRAFRARRSWKDFEAEELRIDTMVVPEWVADEEAAQRFRECSLDNRLRLKVFEQLKARLCQEIWLQKYYTPGDTADATDMARSDSKMAPPKPGPVGGLTEGVRTMTMEERQAQIPDSERTVIGWEKNARRKGCPIYKDDLPRPDS